MVKKILIGALLVLFCAGTGFAVIENSVLNKKGCCSRHGGVCGCKYNKALCCDGSLSPSCGCN